MGCIVLPYKQPVIDLQFSLAGSLFVCSGEEAACEGSYTGVRKM